jgi:hypothetical protein
MSNRIIEINKKKKQAADREKIAGKPWDIPDEHLIRVYDLYKANKITMQQLLEHFPGRTFHAITDKVYFIRGKLGLINSRQQDPNQLSLPLGGALK